MKVDTVMVPLDGSSLAEMALPKAVELLNSPRATLILLRAAEATTTLPWIDPTEAQAAVVREAEAYLATVAAELADQGVTRVIRSVWYSSAASAIVAAARTRSVDLIVMSTHGRSGLRRAIRGSVAESVLRATQTPVLLVSAAGDGRARAATAPVPRSHRPDGGTAAVASSGPSAASRPR